ncbi:hypothetical protein [Lignipirellula cremea]|uniref:Uncharacterized protein n=1 Tax=Lignipirellula cremea TaxID=2528010 RepID=A0A518DSY2_9BACT|nr:hypothetical protein [Lignipirellula cremea]QDU94955.1 hypothetical protein Pla8534_27640 [Lignipirellula cremea]
MLGFRTITDLKADAALLRQGSYGVIEMADEQLVGVHLRPFPKIITAVGVHLRGAQVHRRRPGNRCWLYYNQPLTCRGFLALKYVVSTRDSTLRTFRGALIVLDEIARLKRTAATVCEAANLRISDRLFRRWGWERHCLDSSQRHYIKRFYGEHPAPEIAWSLMTSAS